MKIHFDSIGRDKISWDAEIGTVSFDDLMASLRKGNALRSMDVEFQMDFNDPSKNGQQSGQVLVGGFREVGSFLITP